MITIGVCFASSILTILANDQDFLSVCGLYTVKTPSKNKWIKNTQDEIWSKKYHIQKDTFSLKDENCPQIIKNGCQLD